MSEGRTNAQGSDSKVATFVGFAVKSGKILYGADRIESGRRRCLVIMDSTAGSNTSKLILRVCKEHRIPLLVRKKPLDDLVFKTNCMAIAITDKNLAKGILDNFGDEYIEVK